MTASKTLATDGDVSACSRPDRIVRWRRTTRMIRPIGQRLDTAASAACGTYEVMIEGMRRIQPPGQVAPGWAVAMGRLTRYITYDYGGGRRRLKIAWVINFQKLTTIPLLVVWMHHY